MNMQEEMRRRTLLDNIMFETDSYKLGHDGMYDPTCNQVYSYFESREGAMYPETVFFGLQYYIKRYLMNPMVPDMEMTKSMIESHISEGAFNEKWLSMPTVGEGMDKRFKLPLSIKAVPEGTPVPTGNVLMTVENIDTTGAYRFLTNYMESLLTHVWYPSTIASKSRVIKKLIWKYLSKTCENPEDYIDYMLHDFGYRSTTTPDSAAVGGSANLLYFKGTDTVPALGHIMYYYGADGVVAQSVYATEHSIMTQLGREGEMDVVEALLRNETYKDGILSLVIDSYDWINFLAQMSTDRFKDLILNRKGQVVFRPDSGHPRNVSMKAWQILSKGFGYTTNKLGYKVLNPKIRLLWGDGIDTDGIEDILQGLMEMKVSVQDILFGMGGALLQRLNRDTQRFAFKSSNQERNGIPFDIFKDPIGETGKRSKAGKLALVKTETGYKTVRIGSEWYEQDILKEVFRNGELLIDYSWDQVLQNSFLDLAT